MSGEGMYCAWGPCNKLLPFGAWNKSDFCSDECAEYAMASQAKDAPLFGGALRGDEPLPPAPEAFAPKVDE